jgi:hypothetical protein
LANGSAGGELQWQDSGNANVLAYARTLPGSSLRVVVNLSEAPKEAFGIALPAWGWQLQVD